MPELYTSEIDILTPHVCFHFNWVFQEKQFWQIYFWSWTLCLCRYGVLIEIYEFRQRLATINDHYLWAFLKITVYISWILQNCLSRKARIFDNHRICWFLMCLDNHWLWTRSVVVLFFLLKLFRKFILSQFTWVVDVVSWQRMRR